MKRQHINWNTTGRFDRSSTNKTLTPQHQQCENWQQLEYSIFSQTPFAQNVRIHDVISKSTKRFNVLMTNDIYFLCVCVCARGRLSVRTLSTLFSTEREHQMSYRVCKSLLNSQPDKEIRRISDTLPIYPIPNFDTDQICMLIDVLTFTQANICKPTTLTATTAPES